MKEVIEQIIKLHNEIEVLIQDIKVASVSNEQEVKDFCYKWIQLNTSKIDELREYLKYN